MNKFNGKILKVSYVPFAPLVVPYEDESGQLRVRGISGSMFDAITRAGNMSYRLRLSSDGRYGMLLPNGTFTGALRDVEDKTADMTVNLYFASYPALMDRLRVTQTTQWGKACLLSAMKTAYVSTPVPFTKAFDYWSWILILTSSVLLVYLLTFEPRIKRRASDSLGDFLDSLSVVYQTLLQESTKEKFTGSFAKFVGGLWILATFILSESYRCNGKAYLVVRSPTPRITTFEDLFQRSDMKLYFADNTPTHHTMLTLPGKDGENYRKFEKSFGSPRRPDNIYGDDVINEAIGGKAVLLVDTLSLPTMIPRFCKKWEHSHFYIGWKTQLSYTPIAWVAGKQLGKEFNDHMDQKLLWLIAFGVPSYKDVPSYTGNSACVVGTNFQTADTAEPLGYDGVDFSFRVHGISLILCFFFFVLESLYFFATHMLI